MGLEADLIAAAVLDQFEKLPDKRKPSLRDNGVQEWVPLSGIVARRKTSKGDTFTCLSLATGMKCLPASKMGQARGVTLHDWHAEILAIRAFNHFLVQECQVLTSGGKSSFLRCRDQTRIGVKQGEDHGLQPFEWNDDVSLHMYCSEAPCGDASMELVMAAQADDSPWDVPDPDPAPAAEVEDAGHSSAEISNPHAALPGRAYFSRLGVVRRKPARADAPPSLSKSCSDKLALKQCTSLASSLTSLLVRPAGLYLETVVLPASRFSAKACQRAFSPAGRMAPMVGRRWVEDDDGIGGSYAFVPFRVETCTCEFCFSRQEVAARADRIAASNLAVAWVMDGLEEGLVGGSLHGRKQFHVKAASRLSRREMWESVRRVSGQLEPASRAAVVAAIESSSYLDVKLSAPLQTRRQVKTDTRKDALPGWIRNAGDDDFSLDGC